MSAQLFARQPKQRQFHSNPDRQEAIRQVAEWEKPLIECTLMLNTKNQFEVEEKMLDHIGHDVMAQVLRCLDRGPSAALDLLEVFDAIRDKSIMDVAVDHATKIVDEKGTDVLDY